MLHSILAMAPGARCAEAEPHLAWRSSRRSVGEDACATGGVPDELRPSPDARHGTSTGGAARRTGGTPDRRHATTTCKVSFKNDIFDARSSTARRVHRRGSLPRRRRRAGRHGPEPRRLARRLHVELINFHARQPRPGPAGVPIVPCDPRQSRWSSATYGQSHGAPNEPVWQSAAP